MLFSSTALSAAKSVTPLPNTTASLYVCVPPVVTLPSNCTVPSAFVSTLDAATVDLNHVLPVLFTVRPPTDTPLPTAPANVTAPLPDDTVNPLCSNASESTVPLKVAVPAVNAVSAVSVAGP